MSRPFAPRLDILPAAQQRLWPELRDIQTFGFALYGGTAVALRLGHRVSVDFDFFTQEPIDRNQLNASLSFLDHAQVLQDQIDTLTVLAPGAEPEEESVKVSFFGRIAFGRVGIPDLTNDGVMQIASIDDLMATKLKVVLQRIEAKDYLDISALLRVGANLERGLSAARALYGSAFQPSESLKALTYFQGGDLETLPLEDRQLLVRAVNTVRELPDIQIVSRALVRDQ